MNSNNASSKTAPLRYFEYFLKKESLEAYEKRFFDNSINPSFESNKNEGYIYYLKDSYINDEESFVKLYFIEELEKHLVLQANISLSLINERKDEIENTEKNANIYIDRQLIKMDGIKNSINYFEIYQPVIFSVLEKLKKRLESYIDAEKKVQNTIKTNQSIGTKTFFGLKSRVKLKHLRKLYDSTSYLGIIDDDKISEQDFIQIFTSPKLPEENLKLIFNKDNRTTGYYIREISFLFNNLTPRLIQKSKSFYNKGNKLTLGNKLLNEKDINKVYHFLRHNDTSKYENIRVEIEKIFPK